MTLQINGQMYELYNNVHKTLLEVLREDLGLTGTKHGCELGECGACSVLLDGEFMLSCLTLPVEIEGQAITTIEGLAAAGDVHPLQTAFADLGATQCGYCVPGMLLSAHAGVVAVLAGADLPERYGALGVSKDETALAVEKVRFVGDPVAAVAAVDEETADAALRLIKVTYEPLIDR
ncbi:MAG TPA: 2Fe-2S iron-sulfur cluster-binding protein [Caldilineaceae bacterium]|nr:2Fe-2S iron-sulfur cluster-binding protein [Caldilineaceae bacterium]